MLEACVSSDKVNSIRAIFNLNGISISGKDIRFKDESAIESDSALICPIPVAFIEVYAEYPK